MGSGASVFPGRWDDTLPCSADWSVRTSEPILVWVPVPEAEAREAREAEAAQAEQPWIILPPHDSPAHEPAQQGLAQPLPEQLVS